MMKYRAILNDPGNSHQERPVQILSNSRPDCEAWAAAILEKAVSESASVSIFQTVEELLVFVRKPKPKPKAPEAA